MNLQMLVLLILINEKEISVTTKKEREAYHRWTPADRFRIGEYAAENGNTAAVRKFNAEFPRLNESTAREFKKKYNIKIVNAAKEKREVSKLVPKYSSQTGRPLLLGDLGSIVQTYIKQLSNRGGVLNRTIANTTTQASWSTVLALLVKSVWALLSGSEPISKNGFKKHRKTFSAVVIPHSAREEIEYLFFHDIVDILKFCNHLYWI